MNSLFRLSMLITVSVIVVLSTFFVTTSSQVEHDQDRLVETLSFPNEPVRITEVKSKKGVLKAGVKFKDADGWFKGLRIKIQNTSGKPVNYVSALVTFTRPEGQKEAGRIPFGEPLTYGVSPLEIKKSGPATPDPSIPPGESIELGLAETDFDEYKTLLKRLDFPDAIKRIEITLQEVGFEDGLLWSGGEYYRRDPNDHDKLIRLPKETGVLFFGGAILASPRQEIGKLFPEDTLGTTGNTSNPRL